MRGNLADPGTRAGVAGGALTVGFAATSPKPAGEASHGPDRVHNPE